MIISFKQLSIYLKKKRKKTYLGLFLVLLLIFWFCLPKSLFKDPCSTIIFDKDNKLLAAQIAEDGQWRFPASDSIPEKYKKALIYFEDQYFYYHPGVNPASIFRALKQNISAGRIVSGGSTITQQMIRMSRKNRSRTIYQKLIEFVLALRVELTFSKDEILNIYAANAPFGGNVVGLEAASWRYFGRSSFKLSWSETATLAVLPNAPSLIYPGKNHEILMVKRNRLLDKLLENEIIDSLSCELAKEEELPQKPKAMPQFTPHLLTRVIKDSKRGSIVNSSLNLNLQKNVSRVVDRHYKELIQNEIHNAAALVLDVKNNKVLAYVGNTLGENPHSGHQVDIITSIRSSGSTLKPFLYASMLDEGILLPKTLLADVPTQISGYSPKNFDRKYDGAVHADDALARSLNIPAVRLLQQYGVDKFLIQLKELGFTTIDRSADNYGLSLILGGAEVSLWELANIYAGMSRSLQFYINNSSTYSKDLYKSSSYENQSETLIKKTEENGILGAASIYHTFEALSTMDRPIEGVNWLMYNSSRKIAWKTGTSFGHRDAWAVGVTPEYVVAVWVGNADGEGRPGLTGGSSAAPLLFDIYKKLPHSTWFEAPYDDMVELTICKTSGHKASNYCNEVDTLFMSVLGERTKICPYHKQVFLDKTEQYRVDADCYRVSDMIAKNYFVLPTIMEWYYKSRNPFYENLPPYLEGCSSHEERNLDLIYPKHKTRIFLPKNFDNQMEKSVFKAAHRLVGSTIHWHLDNEYIGSTQDIHEMEITASTGIHYITIIDEDGESLVRQFEIVEKGK